MGKYKVLTNFYDRIFRNDLNANFDEVDEDIKVQKARVDNLITGNPQPEEVMDLRTDTDGIIHGTAWDRFASDETKKATKFQEIDDQLAEIPKEVKSVSVPYNYQGAVFTFIDDDGMSRFYNEMKPVFDTKGAKATLGIITNSVGSTADYMTLSQLIQLQNEGFELVSHSKTHSASVFRDSLATVTDSAIETEYKDSQDWMKANGLKGYDTIVYPYGNFGSEANRYKRLARKYYKNGVNASGSAYNGSPLDNMYIKRMHLNMAVHSLSVIYGKIDEAIANNGWLVFLMHSGLTTEIDAAYLGSVIDYIKSKNMPILPFGEANELKGNSLSVGEYTDSANKVYVGKDGKSLIGNGERVFILGLAPDNGYTIDTPLMTYTTDAISIFKVRNGSTNDPVTGEGGVVSTYNFGDGSNFSYQIYVSASTTRMFKRRWQDATDTWGSWTELSTAIKGTAPPTTGTWKVGDVVENTNPNGTPVKGWICIGNGTPGSWVPFGEVFIQSYGSAAAVATGGTITTSGFTITRVAPTSAVTGVILQAGTFAGQEITVLNESASANSVTFASSGSNVADGSGSVIAGLTAAKFVWNTARLLWYRIK